MTSRISGRPGRSGGFAWLLAGVVAATPTPAAAQEAAHPGAAARGAGAEALSGGLTAFCAVHREADPFLAQVAQARELESPDALDAALDALEPEARRMAAEAPGNAEAQYRLAAVMGARLDLEDGLGKISGASELHDQAARVLALQPEHAGASYMVGKLHASVLRLGGVKRFMATRVLGGGALKGASWDEARELLEVAVRGEPCVPEHHFELARAYVEVGDGTGAARELASVAELTAGQSGRAARLRERAEGFAREWRREGRMP